ncbi:MAG TPA: hypothetical protein VMR25_15685, partial [Planctomycetaceae bacterium]|nr:hypothetical protein [Planctomycetaceae bacterium]
GGKGRVRLICPHWNSTRDWRQGEPPVLTVDHLFGMRLVLTHPHLLSVMVGVIARYYESGNRGPQHLDPRQFILPADSLGLLNHPHVIAISGLQSAVALCRYFDSTLAVTGPRQLEIAA